MSTLFLLPPVLFNVIIIDIKLNNMLKLKFLSYMKSLIKNSKLLVIFLLTIIVFVPALVFAIDRVDEGWRIWPGETKEIVYDAYDYTNTITYNLVNNSAISYFIPTRSLYEWESFVYNFPDSNVSLQDFCGNGLCGICAPASRFGTTAQRIKYSPPSTNLHFDGYSNACENEVTACPADCGTIFCGDGNCTSDYYEDYSNCTADCVWCSSNDYGCDR